MAEKTDENTKVFISYSWSSADHEKWVLNLANQLREDGVDVVIDKWDLKEGHDALAFMEKMVSDVKIKKVIIISDQRYAQKADGRKGGVGTETQIISPELYGKSDQDKFCAVVSEIDADGKPYLPTYFKSRIYIDLSNDESYSKNYEQLLRWIFGKPAYPKPPLGRPPSFVTDPDAILLPTANKARRAVNSIKLNSAVDVSAFREYLDVLGSGFERLRISDKNNSGHFDDQVVASIEEFLPYKNEFAEIIRAIARREDSATYVESLQRFFESIAPFLTRPRKGVSSWSGWDFDNYRFIIHELFLYVAAILLQYERFQAVADLVNAKYYFEGETQYGRAPMQNFGVFYQTMDSLGARNARLKLNRLSLRADLIEQRSHTSGISFRYLAQADFVLFLKDAQFALQSSTYQNWWTETLIFSSLYHAPFEIFARAESKKYFDRLKSIFEVDQKSDLAPLFEAFKAQKLHPPMLDRFRGVDFLSLLAFNKIATST